MVPTVSSLKEVLRLGTDAVSVKPCGHRGRPGLFRSVGRLLGAVREAARYGLYDLDRVERMILRRVAREYFLLNDYLQRWFSLSEPDEVRPLGAAEHPPGLAWRSVGKFPFACQPEVNRKQIRGFAELPSLGDAKFCSRKDSRLLRRPGVVVDDVPRTVERVAQGAWPGTSTRPSICRRSSN